MKVRVLTDNGQGFEQFLFSGESVDITPHRHRDVAAHGGAQPRHQPAHQDPGRRGDALQPRGPHPLQQPPQEVAGR